MINPILIGVIGLGLVLQWLLFPENIMGGDKNWFIIMHIIPMAAWIILSFYSIWAYRQEKKVRQEAVKALIEGEQRMSLERGYAVLDKKGNAVALGKAFVRILGYKGGMPLLPWLETHQAYGQKIQDYLGTLKQAIKNKQTCTKTILWGDRVIELKSIPLTSAYTIIGVEPIGIDRDVIDNNPSAIMGISASGTILYANNTFYTLLGITPQEQEIKRYTLGDFIEKTEILKGGSAYWQAGSSGKVRIKPRNGQAAFWAWLLQNSDDNQDGKVMYMRAVLFPEPLKNKGKIENQEKPLWWDAIPIPMTWIESKGKSSIDNKAMKKLKEEMDADASLLFLKDEKQKHQIQTRIKGIKSTLEILPVSMGQQGQIVLVEDITGRKDLEKSLQHTQRLQVIGQMTGAIAHDFRNLLTAMIAFGDELKKELDRESPQWIQADQIIQNSNKASTMISKMLQFSSNREAYALIIDIGTEINDLYATIVRLIGENIHFNLKQSATRYYTKIDTVEFQQIIMNLIANGRDAMILRKDGKNRKGTITLSMEAKNLTESQPTPIGDIPKGRYTVISITDEGEGIDAQNMKKIFTAYYTTKADKGTGLGLSTVRKIVESAGGYMDIESQKGIGTTVFVYVPVINPTQNEKQQTQKIRYEPEAMENTGNDKTVLLVEDEISVRSIYSVILRKQGYKVLEASDGHAALLIFEQNKDTIDAVITDETMAGMYGHELIKEIRKYRPAMPAILISGYAETAGSKKDTETSFLTKPFMPVDLIKMVQETMRKKNNDQ